MEYLGHLIFEAGVSTDPKKVEAMLAWPKPTTVRALRGFLGLTGYYWQFVKGYGTISKPLTELLKNGGFNWGQKAETAFKKLKRAMSEVLVLGLPDFDQPFVVEIDACDSGIGAILSQKERPLAFLNL